MSIRTLLRNIFNTLCNRTRRLFLPFLLWRSARVYPKLARYVTRLTRSTVIKKNEPGQILREAEALRYVAEHTSIPVPAVYDFWIEDNDNGYLVMQYIEGEELRRRWPRLSPQQKFTVMHTLREFVNQLRALPQPDPQGSIGSTSGKEFCDFRITSQSTYGPFSSEAAYNDWRISTFSMFAEIHPPTGIRLKELRAAMSDHHKITYTHGDIARQNILVCVDGEGADDLSIVALLDWEQSAWMPEYWEANKFVYGEQPTRDWFTLGRNELVPGYDKELDIENELHLISGPPL